MYALQCLHNGMTIYSVADLLTNGIGLEVMPVKNTVNISIIKLHLVKVNIFADKKAKVFTYYN